MKRLLTPIIFLLSAFTAFGQLTDAQLTTKAVQIRDETAKNANTSTRIGTLFKDLVDSKANLSVIPLSVTLSGTNTYTGTVTPAITAYVANQSYFITVPNANTGASTLNLNALGAVNLQKIGNVALSSGELPAGIHLVVYTGAYFQLISGAGGGGGGGDALTTNPLSQFASTTSAQLAGVISNETGTGSVVFSDNPTFTNLASSNIPKTFMISISDLLSAPAAGTGRGFFAFPTAITITGVYAYVKTAQTSGSILTFDINEAGTTILGASNKLSIDNNENGSNTAATAVTITDSAIAAHALMTIDVDQVGTGSVGGIIVIEYK